MIWYDIYIYTMWCPPSDVCWFIKPMNTIVISAINHSYGSCKPTYLTMGHHLVYIHIYIYIHVVCVIIYHDSFMYISYNMCSCAYVCIYIHVIFFYSVPIKTNATTYICYNYCTEDHVRDLVQINCIYIYMLWVINRVGERIPTAILLYQWHEVVNPAIAKNSWWPLRAGSNKFPSKKCSMEVLLYSRVGGIIWLGNINLQ